jgi:hypothetical protein
MGRATGGPNGTAIARRGDGGGATATAATATLGAPVETQRRVRRHALLTKSILRSLAALGAQDGKGLDATARVKFFHGSRGMFLATEFDGDDKMFGYSVSNDGPAHDGFAYASFREMEQARNPRMGGIPAVERDCYWPTMTVRDALVYDGVPVPVERAAD